MNSERYVLTDDRMVIFDEELGIDLQCHISLPRLPFHLQDSLEPSLILEKDEKGILSCAYLVLDGRRHGQCRYFTNGTTLRSEMFYCHGQLHGPSLAFTEEGGVLAKSWYFQGKKTGKAHFYFANGKLSSLQRYKEGQWEKEQEYFYEEGTLKSCIPFSKGKLHGEVRLFWESGILKRQVFYKEGLREGWDRLWNQAGKLLDEGEYLGGQPVGRHRHFFPNGQLKEERYFHTPTRFDRCEWDLNGKLVFEGLFAQDLTYTEKIAQETHGMRVRKGIWNDNRICFH